MPWQIYHSQVIRAYLLHMIIRDNINSEKDVDELIKQLEMDKEILEGIHQTCENKNEIIHPTSSFPSLWSPHLDHQGEYRSPYVYWYRNF